ncbi:MAG: hypothetical protein M1816_003382 [Peltula sp. TS41687]|nr:MAG: hypothetical protein M1816_003382 [Peltula sp. TS41687]
MWFNSSNPTTTTVYQLRAEVPFDATYHLSLADNIPPSINSRNLLIYSTEHETETPEVFRASLVDRLKRSLESFLRQPEEGVLALPQLLGKIHQDPESGRLSVKVTETSSIPFVVSTADHVTLQQLRPDLGFPSRCLDPKLFATGMEAIAKPDRSGGFQSFNVQLTFITGGFVICLNKHHYLLDATAVGHLIRWWFKRAACLAEDDKRLVKLKVETDAKTLAVHDQSALTLHKPVPPQDHPEWKVVSGAGPYVFGFPLPSATVMFIAKHLPFVKPPKIGNAVFHFTPAALSELHATLQAQTTGWISTHDAVCALVWRCVTRARLQLVPGDSRPEKSMISLAVNSRRKLDPPLAEEYFGNAAFLAPSSMPVGMLTDTELGSLAVAAAAIRNSIATKTTDTHLRSLLQLMAAQKKASDVVNSFKAFMGHDVFLTSWDKCFGSMREFDVGCGQFQRLRLPGGGAFDGLAVVMPTFGQRDTAGLEVTLDLIDSHLNALKADSEWKRYTRCLDDES